MLRMIKWLFILAVVMGCVFVWAHTRYQQFIHRPMDLGGSERVIQISSGMHAGQVVNLLKDSGVIEHDWMMLYCLKESGLSSKIQPGPVVLSEGMTPAELPELLARVGKYARLTVQILPGMNLDEIAVRMQKQRVADAKVFLQMTRDPARAAELGVPAKSMEGYLAPGAYTFDVGVDTEKVIEQMHHRWRENWLAIVAENRGAYDFLIGRHYNDHALVTLASLVEKEAVVDAERPVIARVFFNRLRKKMMLQSDPTCIYPPKVLGEKPSPARCKDASNAYSTYVHQGLPPGPIAMPSNASLRAVLKPYSGPDDALILYFVARQDGSKRHYFSKTYAEHQTAVNYFLKDIKKSIPKGTVQPLP